MDSAQQVIAVAHERAAALVAGDADKLRTLLHEQFSWTTHLGETLDRSDYIRRNTDGSTVWRAQQLADISVVVVADTAVLRAEVSDAVLSAGDDVEIFQMPMTQVWVRAADEWACLAGHAGPRRRPGGTPRNSRLRGSQP